MLRKVVLVLGASALFLTNIACHTFDISITDNEFTPSEFTDGLSVEVIWTNNGSDTHNVTSSGNGVFFQSSDLAPTATFSHDFNAAGLYKYKCTLHPTEMKGTIGIQVGLSTATASKDDTIQVFWATDDDGPYTIPDGFNVDVQINKPGPGGFEDWRINQKDDQTGTDYTVKRNGTYKFRARFQKGNGHATAYSPPSEVVVGGDV